MKKVLSLLLFVIPFIANGQTPITNNLLLSAPKSLDSRVSKFVGGKTVPFASVSEANTLIPVTRRCVGLTVIVGADTSSFAEYWYYGGVQNSNLIAKSTGGGGSGNATQIQGVTVSATTPTAGQVLQYNGTSYIPTTPSGGGGSGTVTSVGVTVPSAFSATGSPITTSGTIGITANGTSAQYVNGAGSLTTFPTLFTKAQADTTYTKRIFSTYNITDYGAVGDGVFLKDGAISIGTTTLNSASANFTTADVGKSILVDSMGTGYADVLCTIIARLSSHSVTLSTTAGASVVAGNFRYGTDNTTPIQNAINAAWTAYSGKVFIPKGVFFVAGNLVTSDNSGYNPNSQLYFPSVKAVYDGGPNVPPRVISIEGAVAPGLTESAFIDSHSEGFNNGSIIESILPKSLVSGKYPALLGTMGYADAYGSFNVCDVVIHNLWVRNHHDHAAGAYMSGIFLPKASNSTIEYCRADVDQSIFKSQQPQDSTYGIVGTESDGGTEVRYTTDLAIGYRIGYTIGEHSVVDNCAAFGCVIGLDVQQAGHSSIVYRFLSQWNIDAVSAGLYSNIYSTGYHYINFNELAIERYSSGGGKWYNAAVDVYDPANIISGTIIYSIGVSGSAPNKSTLLTLTGGSNISSKHVSAGALGISNPFLVGTDNSTPGGPGTGLPGQTIIQAGSSTAGTSLGYDQVGSFQTSITQSNATSLIGQIGFFNKAATGADKRLGLVQMITGADANNGTMNFFTMVSGTPTQTLSLQGGSVAVGAPAPAASAKLDVTSTTQGVLFPRLTTTQRNAISSPAIGLTIYNTTTLQLESFNGTVWAH